MTAKAAARPISINACSRARW